MPGDPKGSPQETDGPLSLSLELLCGAVGAGLKAEARLGPQLCPSPAGPPWTSQFPFCLPFFHLYYEGSGRTISKAPHLCKLGRLVLHLLPPACVRLRIWFISASLNLPQPWRCFLSLLQLRNVKISDLFQNSPMQVRFVSK